VKEREVVLKRRFPYSGDLKNWVVAYTDLSGGTNVGIQQVQQTGNIEFTAALPFPVQIMPSGDASLRNSDKIANPAKMRQVFRSGSLACQGILRQPEKREP
jgi:hypothetical protein